MRVPVKTLKFGPYQVSVKTLSKADAEKHWGLYWPHRHQIDLHREYPTKERAAETSLHEAIHVILEERGIELGRQEERAVTELSKGLIAFFRDNPDYRKWFMRCLG